MGKLNTIYIISKGRPQCRTAQTLTKYGYTGEWFIVCGNNDETIPEYKKIWGDDKILIFDWYEEVKTTNLLDNFGVENMSSGAVPVRNATRKISANRGELRHWQFDDDYVSFYKINPPNSTTVWHKLDGNKLETELSKLSQFAHKAQLNNIGFVPGSDSRPETVKQISKRVFNAHNLPNDPDLFHTWKGRMNDDLINAIEIFQKGGYELSVKYMQLVLAPTQSEQGGNTDIYELSGTVRKTAYAVMIDPKNVKLVIAHGRYHHQVAWQRLAPRLIRETHAKI